MVTLPTSRVFSESGTEIPRQPERQVSNRAIITNCGPFSRLLTTKDTKVHEGNAVRIAESFAKPGCGGIRESLGEGRLLEFFGALQR